MEDSAERSKSSGEEVFMTLLLAVLIPIMLLAANLDLRSQVDQALRRSFQASSIRISFVNSDDTDAKPRDEMQAAPEVDGDAIIAVNALRNLENPVTASDKPAVSEALQLSLMSLDFSLAELNSTTTRLPTVSGGPLKVNKPVYAGARLIGDLQITIAGEGELLLEASEVKTIMGQQRGAGSGSPSRVPEQGLVSFATLREIGIDLRYSPSDDVIRVNP